jgi:hypothetical protein
MNILLSSYRFFPIIAFDMAHLFDMDVLTSDFLVNTDDDD